MEPDNVIDCNHSDFDEKERAGVKYDFCTGCIAWRDASDVVTPGPWMLTERPKKAAPTKPKPKAAGKEIVDLSGLIALKTLRGLYQDSGAEGRHVIRELLAAVKTAALDDVDIHVVLDCLSKMDEEDLDLAELAFDGHDKNK